MPARVALALLALLAASGCRSTPPPERGVIGQVSAYYTVEPDTGRLVEGCPDGGPVTVVLDTVAVADDRLTVVGTAEIEGRGGVGWVRFESAWERTGIPAPPEARPRPGPAPWAPPSLPDTALAYGAPLTRSGRFALRAPLAEVRADTLFVAYTCVPSDDWVRIPVADLLAGTRFAASEPGAVPNPEARGVDGLRLLDPPTASPGDSVRLVLAYRPLAPSTMFPPDPDAPVRSPSVGTDCLGRLERWADGWREAPRALWRDPDDDRFGCTAQGLAFDGPGERPVVWRLAPTAPPGRYRWCLDASTERAGPRVVRPVCSTAWTVR
ncbi:hypothetical protein [Rubrivirga sp. IMCC45206]|uniref:hypothetical protein n=1 Tax=Rubrivirga sp. IMCC45206 TaxID=3391614 RepID=UPI0039903A05